MTDPVRTLIDELIESQRRLDTPVARFAAAHDSDLSAALAPQLIPLSAPAPGEQYAFQVDLDSCTGCKACVAGCHSLNGLDEEETWRDVGLMLGGTATHPLQQTITTACHHCESPACLEGCPVLAYDKDPLTGIVRHLDDQCIGCSYCVLKCPYEVPKYNDRLGIVRKCDMCHGRLAAGEAPACVQACPTQAITIVTIKRDQPATTSHERMETISGTDSDYTRPTTRYVSRRPLPAGFRASDTDTLRPQHAHFALVFLLVCTQLGLGLMAAAQIVNQNASVINLTGLGLFAAGLMASVAHLGQPFRAWRIFLGLRRSWLSREAVLLGAAFPLLVAASAGERIPVPILHSWQRTIALAGLATATLGVVCSAMIYVDTRRRFWRPSQSFGRMVGTVFVATLAVVHPALAALSLAAKLALELSTCRDGSVSARLQQGPLRRLWGARLVMALITLPLLLSGNTVVALALLLVGELLERTLFFQAVDSPKMPGVPAA